MSTSRPSAARSAQGGFVLITSLVFLVLITLLAVSAINSSTLQERMAGNLRDKSHSRQNADAALRDAESILHQAAFDTYKTAGTCYPGAASSSSCSAADNALHIWTENQMFSSSVTDYSVGFLDPTVWTNSVIQTYSAEQNENPVQFFVEDMRSQFQARDLNPDTAATAQGGAVYRITARAQGKNPSAVAVTQSLYEKRY